MRNLINDPEELATQLRNAADRIEDGEYGVHDVELSHPDFEGERDGHFKIKFTHRETFEKWRVAFEEQTE